MERDGKPREVPQAGAAPAVGGGGAQPPGRATIAMVADHAGVSRATVSRVMNEQKSVGPELATRVRNAARVLGYEPSAVAQSLARGRTGLVGFVVPDLANPVFQEVLRGLSDGAGSSEHRVLVADTHEVRDEERFLAREVRRRCDALVMCSPRMPDHLLAELMPALQPCVLVNRRVEGLGVPTVSIDHASGIRAIAQHLTTLGHRRVAYLEGPPTSAANRQRLDTLRRTALGRFSLVELEAGPMFADGFRTADRAVAEGATGIICYNDLVACGVLARLHDLGVATPEAVSVTGFDDIPFARYATPSLTTVAVPKDGLGREAWERTAALLAGRDPPADALFTPQLIVRASSGPPPGR